MSKPIAVKEIRGLKGTKLVPSDEPLIRASMLAIATPTQESQERLRPMCSNCLPAIGTRQLGAVEDGQDLYTAQICRPRSRVFGKRNCLNSANIES